jgi:hypothetical protein
MNSMEIFSDFKLKIKYDYAVCMIQIAKGYIVCKLVKDCLF